MKFGVTMFPTDYAIPPHELAIEAEARGFESVWFPEHSHIPTSRKSPWPGGPELPKYYYDSYDPFVAMGAAAVVTKTIKLGTGVCLVVQRDPIHTAKEVATVDRLSNGRLLFGVGGGWNKPEMENHGTDYATRFQRLEEQLQALKTIWTEDEAEYHGTHVDFAPMWLWPKPVSKPHPPIFIGGETDHTLRRIAKYADGWLPRVRDPQLVLAGIARLREFARAEGRDPDSIAISAFGLAAKPEAIAPFADAGVGRAILAIAPGSLDDMLRRLDRYAELVR